MCCILIVASMQPTDQRNEQPASSTELIFPKCWIVVVGDRKLQNSRIDLERPKQKREKNKNAKKLLIRTDAAWYEVWPGRILILHSLNLQSDRTDLTRKVKLEELWISRRYICVLCMSYVSLNILLCRWLSRLLIIINIIQALPSCRKVFNLRLCVCVWFCVR